MNLKYIFAAALGATLSAAAFTLLSCNQTSDAAAVPTLETVEHSSAHPQQTEHKPEIQSTLNNDDADAKIASLVKENQQLRKEMEVLREKLEFHEMMRRELAKADEAANKHQKIQESIKAKKQNKPWADTEIEKAYPEPFADFMKNSKGVYREEYHDFQYEPVNEEWAYKMETQIRDFIQLNSHAHLVEISVLDCKSYRCQLGLLVQEPEKKAWKRIFDEMSLEPWFRFHRHSSAPLLDSSYNIIGNFFFMENTPLG